MALLALKSKSLNMRRDDAKTVLALSALDTSLEVIDRVRLIDVDNKLAPKEVIKDSHLLNLQSWRI